MNGIRTQPNMRETSPRVVVLDVVHQAMKNYTYLVVDPVSRKSVLVDPAWEIDKIENALLESRSTLSGILITHAHPDHIHLANPIADRYGCPIWMSAVEIGYSGFRARQLVPVGGDPWYVGAMLIEPVLTPGHTPGCICCIIGENVFSGDVLFAEGCGICPDVEAAHAMFASLEFLKVRLSPATRVFPGHSYGVPPGQTMAQLLRDNIYLQFKNKEAFAAFRLRRGQSAARMFAFR